TKLRGCNPSFVVTSDGVVQIDTPQLPTRAVAMRAEAESHGPIRYLINTENHVDHIFGNWWFRDAGEIVNHQALYDIFMDPGVALDAFSYALEALERIRQLDVDHVVPGHGPVVALDYMDTQRAVLLRWKAAVADGVAKGWSREETIAKVRFDDEFGPVDVGQGYMMDHIQNNN